MINSIHGVDASVLQMDNLFGSVKNNVAERNIGNAYDYSLWIIV